MRKIHYLKKMPKRPRSSELSTTRFPLLSNSIHKKISFLWIHMVPQFLYLEDLMVLRQVMKSTRFAKGIRSCECPIGVFDIGNYQDVCPIITLHSCIYLNETDCGSRRKFQKSKIDRLMTLLKFWNWYKSSILVNKNVEKLNIIKRYTICVDGTLQITRKSLVYICHSKGKKTFVQDQKGFQKAIVIYVADRNFLSQDVILDTINADDEHIKIYFQVNSNIATRALIVKNVNFDLMGNPLNNTSYKFHLEIAIHKQLSIQITSNASIITIDGFSSTFNPYHFGNNHNLKELRLICYDPLDDQLCSRIKEVLEYNGQWFHLELLYIQLNNHSKESWDIIVKQLKLLELDCLIKIEIV